MLRTFNFFLLFAATLALCTPAHADGGWIQVFKDDAYGGDTKTINFRTSYSNLRNIRWDDNTNDGMNDDITSIRYVVPEGWELQLCSDSNYRDVLRALRGSGEIAHLRNDHDKISSIRWVKLPE